MRRGVGVALVVALLALAYWLVDGRERGAPGAAAPDSGGAAAQPSEDGQFEDASGRESEARAELPVSGGAHVEARAVESAAARPRGQLTVTVRHKHAAVEGATIELAAAGEPVHDLFAESAPRTFVRRALSDAAGRATIEDLAVGRYSVRASATSDGRALQGARFVRVDAAGTETTLHLDFRRRLSIRVVDDARAPVPGARVEVLGGGAGSHALDPGAFEAAGLSDGDGRFEVDADGLAGLVAVATAPDGRTGSSLLGRADQVQRALHKGTLELRVGAAARLHGRVLGVGAETLGGARVLAQLAENTGPYHSTVWRTFETPVLDGAFDFASLPAGRYALALLDPGGARLELPELLWGSFPLANSQSPLVVELEAGSDVERDLPARAGAALAGRVRDDHGQALSNVLVRVTFAPNNANFPDGFTLRGAHVWRLDYPTRVDDGHPATHWSTRTDAEGRYRIAGLPPGRHRVEVAAQGRAYDRREAVELTEGTTVELEHTLAPAGALAGVLRRAGYVGVLRGDTDQLLMVAVLPDDGLFRFEGLAAGTYRLAAAHSSAEIAPVVLAEAEVRACETTWIDLDQRARWPYQLRGRVVGPLGAVEGARVMLGSRAARTDADGNFVFGMAFAPGRDELEFDVLAGELKTGFRRPGMAPGETSLEVLLALGAESLRVLTLDAFDNPTTARVTLTAASVATAGVVSFAFEGDIAGGERTLDGLHPGVVEVSAVFPDGAVARSQAPLPSTEPLVLRAPQSGSITVRARRASGEPSIGLRLSARAWTGAGPAPADELAPGWSAAESHAATDETGLAVLRGVPVGEVLVRAVRFRDWTVDAGETPMVLRLKLAHGQHAELELIDTTR